MWRTGRRSGWCRARPGSETPYGDPLAAAMAWQDGRRGVDPPGRPGRGVRPRQQPRTARRGDRQAGRPGRAVRRHPRRRLPGSGPGAPAPRRVNIGTAALEDPEWCDRIIQQYGDRVAIGLDVRGRTLAARGWTKEGGDLYEVLERLETAGCERYVVTDVTKDGMLQGPNLDLYRDLCARTDKPIIASGGVSSLDDLQALGTLVDDGVEGVIVGKALYAGAFTLTEALELTRGGDK